MHEGFGVKPGEHIPGMTVHKYLCEYADHFGLTKRMRLNSKALSAEKLQDGKWEIEVKESKTANEPARTYKLQCEKLIVATGLTSQPVRLFDADLC